MIKAFFQDKFEYDFNANMQWFECVENQEDEISDFTNKSMSHIINVHYIWNCRLRGIKPESSDWDLLPIHYYQRFIHQNYQETLDYLEKIELGEKVNYHSSEGVKFTKKDIDILYHILNHSNYHRAQIVMDLKNQHLKTPSFNFITYRL